MSILPRLAEGGTVVCLASGPSLTAEDVEYVRGKAVVIAINDAVRLAPWADVLYSSDAAWWQRHQHMPTFPGLRVRLEPGCARPVRRVPSPEDGVLGLRNTGERGLELEPDGIRTTLNSGGSAINVAVHLGAKRIVLLGYDMGPDSKGRRHFYDTHAQMISSPFMQFRKLIATMVEPLQAIGVEVVNCSRRTNLEHFPCRPLRDVLEAVAA